MSRALFIAMTEADVTLKCAAENVGISAIEALPTSGVRLVCMSVNGADVMRRKLKAKLIEGEYVARVLHRPRSPLW